MRGAIQKGLGHDRRWNDVLFVRHFQGEPAAYCCEIRVTTTVPAPLPNSIAIMQANSLFFKQTATSGRRPFLPSTMSDVNSYFRYPSMVVCCRRSKHRLH